MTGGAGFIGSNFVRYVLTNTDDEVTVYDALTYAGNLSTLRDVDDDPRFRFVKGNICDPAALEDAMAGTPTPSCTSRRKATSTARSSAPTTSSTPTASAPTS